MSCLQLEISSCLKLHCFHHLLPPVKKVCYNLRTPSYELIVHKLKQTRCSYLGQDGVWKCSCINLHVVVVLCCWHTVLCSLLLVFTVWFNSVSMCVCHVETIKLTYLQTGSDRSQSWLIFSQIGSGRVRSVYTAALKCLRFSTFCALHCSIISRLHSL